MGGLITNFDPAGTEPTSYGGGASSTGTPVNVAPGAPPPQTAAAPTQNIPPPPDISNASQIRGTSMFDRMGSNNPLMSPPVGTPPQKQSVLKKILLGVLDTVAASRGFPTHYDYERRDQEDAQRAQELKIRSQMAAQSAIQFQQVEAQRQRDQAPAQFTPEQAQFLGQDLRTLQSLGLTSAQQRELFGAKIGAMANADASNSRFSVTHDAQTGAITIFDRQAAIDAFKNGGDVSSALKTFNIRGQAGAPAAANIDKAVNDTLTGAGVNVAKLTAAQRAGLAFAKQQASQTGNIKPVEDWVNKVMSAEASRSNMVIRMEGLTQMRQYPVLDTRAGNAPKYVSAEELNRAATEEPGRYLSQSGGAPALKQENVLNDIRGSVQQVKEALGPMGEFRPAFRGQLAVAMRASDPASATSALINSSAFGQMAPDEQNYLIKVNQLTEQVMGLRAVLGMGQGSDMMRGAIKATVPGSTTPSKQTAYKMLDAIGQVMDRLERGVPQVPLRGEGGGTNSPADNLKPTHRFNPATGKIEALSPGAQ